MTGMLDKGFVAGLSLLLVSCDTTAPVPEPLPEPVVVVETVGPAEPEPDTGPSDEILRAMFLADMLFAAVSALEDNRLMPPARDNAYEQFRAVLDFAPDNAVALKGMSDIVKRYIALADNAITVDQYDQAAGYLAKASAVGAEAGLLAAARQRLKKARETTVEFYPLDAAALSVKSADIMAELGEIGESIHRREARFLITARSDEEGRWIYQVMRDAIGGQRLRGNISIGTMPGIQVTLPTTE